MNMIQAVVRLPLLLLPFAAAPPSPNPCGGSLHGRLLPSEFIAGRIFVHWHLRSGADLRFYLDTGGNTWVFPQALSRLGAPIDTTARNGYSVLSVRLSSALGDAIVLPVAPGPPTAGSSDTVVVMVSPQAAPDYGIGLPVDGLLGGYWFADRVWVLDYLGQRLLFNGTAPTGPRDSACWVPLGFQIYPPTGQRTTQFPRIAARVDGEEIQFLLDTGARTTLTDSAWQAIGAAEPRQRAASFITQSRLDAWHQRHPDWPVVGRAEEGDSASMIRVPTIRVGAEEIGPVWFTARPDRSFRVFMSQYMDEPVEGSLGGSAWEYVTLILDYPRARAAILPGRR